MRVAFFLAASLAIISTASGAGLSDKKDCMQGPVLLPGSGIESIVDYLERRTIACFNFSEERGLERDTDVRSMIFELQERIDMLESTVQELKSDRNVVYPDGAPPSAPSGR